MQDHFETATLNFLLHSDKNERKSLGQFFTPKPLRERLLSLVGPLSPGWRVLDPACGTGELLLSCRAAQEDLELHGWEIDTRLASIARTQLPGAHIQCGDALKLGEIETYDLVIGNPPYYEFIPAPHLRKQFGDVIHGRTNIYGLFFKIGLERLKPGGLLAYIVPSSMNNGAYFRKLRRYIIEHANIEHLEILTDNSLFEGAYQQTMLIVLRKGPNRGDFVFRKNGFEIFCQDPKFLEETFHTHATLKELGFKVRTGNIVWNRLRSSLSHESSPQHTFLVWSNNLGPHGLKVKVRNGRPQYVRAPRTHKGPAIVVNRVTGATSRARLKAALIPRGETFVAENHCNVIFPLGKTAHLLPHILKELRSPDKLKIVRMLSGNTQISKSELENLFPMKVREAASS